jgi:peroxin-12
MGRALETSSLASYFPADMDLLASSVLDSSPLPSFFEMVMTRQIELSLRPAARHVLVAFANRAPFLFGLVDRFDEVYFALSAVVEARFLGDHDCLLGESFYGLRRSTLSPRRSTPTAMAGDGLEVMSVARPLTQRDRRKSLLLAVLLPYLKGKLDAAHTKLSERENEGRHEEPARLRRLFLLLYPLLHLTYEGSFLIYQWLYLFRRTVHFNPLLALTGQVVRRSKLEDFATPATSGDSVGAGSLISRLGDKASRYGRWALVAAVVAFKVMEWWTAVEAEEGGAIRRSNRSSGAPVPPPPLPPKFAPDSIAVPQDAGICGLCGLSRVNPAVLRPSGFVFCFRCAIERVQEKGKCPVTGLACHVDEVLRIYDDDGRRSTGYGGHET